MVFIPHSLSTLLDLRYTHTWFGPVPGLCFLARVGHLDMEPLQQHQYICCKVPRLAAVKKDQLHYCLVELGADLWWGVVRLWNLANASPFTPSLLIWLRTACISSSSWARILLRYWKKSTFSNTAVLGPRPPSWPSPAVFVVTPPGTSVSGCVASRMGCTIVHRSQCG
jgi:hypothetical protein